VAMGYLLFAGAMLVMLPAYAAPGVVKGICGPLITIALFALPVYVLGVFTYGFDGADVFARESCFPVRWFLLPVRTDLLVLWPMVCGAAAAILLWLAIAWFLLRPWAAFLHDEAPPLWWPGLFMAACVAWLQAVLWSPFGLPAFRLILLSALTPLVITLAAFGAHSGVAEEYFVASFAGLTVVAWTVGYIGIIHARRGNVPNWEWILGPLRYWTRCLPRRRMSFPSAARAQMSFEWRLTGKTLPIMTAMILPFALIPLLFSNDLFPIAKTLLGALTVPLFLAGIAGGWPGGGHNRWVKDHPGLMPFLATLPMTNADLVGAMLKAAALSTLAAWVLVLLAVPLGVALTRNLEEVAKWWRHGLEHDPAKFAAGIVTAVILLVVWTWKRKVDSLYLGLTGRKWIGISLALAFIPGSLALWVIAGWIYKRPEHHETTLAVLPWLLGLLILCRLLAAAWALRQVLRQGLLAPRTVARLLATWLLLGSVLFGVLAWSVAPGLVPVYYLAFAVLFALPMARLAAAPLALAWNRHR
jgi:hypothetical protein